MMAPRRRQFSSSLSKPHAHCRNTVESAHACASPLRTIAASNTDFTNKNHLKLNSSKLEILSVAKQHKDPEMIDIAGSEVITASAVKFLGIWWQYNLSASRSVQEKISKARKAIFAFGNIGTFHGILNPLSAQSIFETCIIPILLWL